MWKYYIEIEIVGSRLALKNVGGNKMRKLISVG